MHRYSLQSPHCLKLSWCICDAIGIKSEVASCRCNLCVDFPRSEAYWSTFYSWSPPRFHPHAPHGSRKFHTDPPARRWTWHRSQPWCLLWDGSGEHCTRFRSRSKLELSDPYTCGFGVFFGTWLSIRMTPSCNLLCIGTQLHRRNIYAHLRYIYDTISYWEIKWLVLVHLDPMCYVDLQYLRNFRLPDLLTRTVEQHFPILFHRYRNIQLKLEIFDARANVQIETFLFHAVPS